MDSLGFLEICSKQDWLQMMNPYLLLKKTGLSHLVICPGISFIGQGLDKVAMIDALDDCLVSEDDLLKGRILDNHG